jgi:hypothetical protein
MKLQWQVRVRTVLTSGRPLDQQEGDVPRDVRFMQKPWRALEVLMEAEKAAQAYRRN